MSLPSLEACVMAAAASPEYVANWMRLRGVRLPASPIESLIDAQTGYGDAIAQMFFDDVRENIFNRMPQA